MAEDIIRVKVDLLITSQISEALVNKMGEEGIRVVIKNYGTVYDLIDEAHEV